ncbi:hypothetical protein [Paenibacillus sp. M-152]|uniref:hypothetical protein n=1 Tax=Paenibacillus sp. M-152 TaxID=2487928 RepID=UPI001F0BF791|nr:hypothetical protein [Paenibacillus sp. M-152]
MAQKLQKKRTRLTGRIVLPGNPSYNTARMEFNRRFSKFPSLTSTIEVAAKQVGNHCIYRAIAWRCRGAASID